MGLCLLNPRLRFSVAKATKVAKGGTPGTVGGSAGEGKKQTPVGRGPVAGPDLWL